ncbi:NUDIX hydrolase [Candidatus Saccharibacteria bacterium]|nr:NUDIX hydrolase [Candidatus Saccharibacteria bacterium]
MNSKPDVKTSFVYEGKKILCDWYDLVGKNLPDIEWGQVYIIGDLNGQVPVVVSGSKGGHANLPGGHTEPGETVEQTLHREVLEELNMKVIEWHLLGYQHLTDPDDRQANQLRVYAKLEKIGEFIEDPGGSITGHFLVDLDKVDDHIEYGVIGERLMKLAKPFFDKGAK